MKVVHVCLSKNGGAANAAWRLHKAMLAEGINSWFFTLEPRGVENISENWICWQDEKKTKASRIPNYIKRKWRQLIFVKRNKVLAKLEEEYTMLKPCLTCEISSLPVSEKNILDQAVFNNADIVHLHWVTLLINYTDFFYRCRKKFKLVWTFHDLNPVQGLFNYEYDIEANPHAGRLEKKLQAFKLNCLEDYGAIIEMIGPSAWITEKTRASIFSRFYHCNLIPYCLDPADNLIEAKQVARTTLGLPARGCLFLSVIENSGNGRKNAGLVRQLAKSFPAARFIAVGRDTGREEGPANYIRAGFISDKMLLMRYYQAADAVLITSVEDNLPNVMLEAFAGGRPVLSFAAGGMQEHVIEGITGYQAKGFTSAAMAAVITKFLDEGIAFDAETIRNYAVENFNNKKVVNAHLAVYKKATGVREWNILKSA